MHLTFHIGPHKTGTTALQTAFATGGRALRKAGVCYPRTNWLYPAHHRLAFALKNRPVPGVGTRPDREKEMLELLGTLERTDAAHVLLSSEEFFAVPKEALSWLKNWLVMDRVSVVIFLRRPDAFLVSSYCQKIRQPGNGFAAPIRRFVSNPRQIAPEIDYLACIGAWADVLGDASIRLHSYEDTNPLATVLGHLGVPRTLLRDDREVNRSPPGAVTEAMRQAKQQGFSADQQRRLLKRALKIFADDPPFYLADEDRLSIIRAFQDDNDALFARFGQTNPYTVQQFTPVAAKKNHNLNHGDLLRLFGELV